MGNKCFVRMFCGCLGQPGCDFYDPGAGNRCLFYNEYKGRCCSPAAINDMLIKQGFFPQEGEVEA